MFGDPMWRPGSHSPTGTTLATARRVQRSVIAACQLIRSGPAFSDGGVATVTSPADLIMNTSAAALGSIYLVRVTGVRNNIIVL